MKTITDLKLCVASAKAQEATIEYLAANGENPMGCGFAWVVVKGARGNKAKMLKDFGFNKRYDGPGLSFWNPSKHLTQDMDAKMAGAETYAAALRDMGLDATAYCRMD